MMTSGSMTETAFYEELQKKEEKMRCKENRFDKDCPWLVRDKCTFESKCKQQEGG